MASLENSFDHASIPPPIGNLEVAIALARAGFHVFPCQAEPEPGKDRPSKAPIRIRPDKRLSWASESSLDLDRIASWWRAKSSALVGIDLGKASLIVIDPDRHGAKDGVAAFDELVAEHGLPAGVPISVTHSGGRHYFFRQPDGLQLGNREGRFREMGINVRGAGGYVIAPGSVAADGAGWRCQEGMPDLADAFEADAIPVLPDWIVSLIKAPKTEHLTQAPVEIGSVAPSRPSADHRDYALAGLVDECQKLACEPTGGRNNALYEAAFKMGTMVGAGWLSRREVEAGLHEAAAANGSLKDDGLRQVRGTIKSGLDSGAMKPREPLRERNQQASHLHMPTNTHRTASEGYVLADAETGEIISDRTTVPATAPAALMIKATPYGWPAADEIPPREWLYARTYIRRFVTATISPGGVGKSSLTIAEALAMISGRPLLHGIAPDRALNVWIINLEDPIDELQRRIAATAMHFGIGRRDAVGSLYVDSGRDQQIVIAETTRNGFQIVRPIVDALLREISERRIDVVIVDPFVASHRLAENDNTAIDAVAREWATIANKTGCAISLVHHSRKTGGAEITVEDARGASALVSAARVARALNQMTKEEAAKCGVENHRAFFRVDNGKSSMAPAGEDATWYQLRSVDLGNIGNGETGDSVGVVEGWKWPNAHEGVQTEDLRAIQTQLASGSYRFDVQAKAWAGNVIADVLDLDPSEASAKIRIKQLLNSWIKSGHLKIVQAPNEKRMMKDFVTMGTPADHHAPRAAP